MELYIKTLTKRGYPLANNETTVSIETQDAVTIEGKAALGDKGRSAVLCHPHSLYGGNMDNNVVMASRDVLLEIGIGTLRFNFRGVGRSTGVYGDGIHEALDVAAAHHYLKDQGQNTIHAVAYSFGSWVLLQAVAKGLTVASSVLIAPPVTSMDFNELQPPSGPCLIVVGDQDPYANPADLKRWLDLQSNPSPSTVILEETDHFYHGGTKALQQEIRSFYTD